MTSALAALTITFVGSFTGSTEAQRLRFPPSASVSPTTTYVPFQSTSQPYRSITANQPVFMASQPAVTLGVPQPALGGPPTFDAYAPTGGAVNQPAFQQPYVQQPYVQPGTTTGLGWGGAAPFPSSTGQYQFIQPNGTYGSVPRFLQQARGRYTWLNGGGGSTTELGINTIEVDGTFIFPLFYMKDPFLLTPGFAVHFLDGLATHDLPDEFFDAYVELGWQPVMTQWLKADLAVRVGVYSDFQKWNDDSLRILGRGLAIWSHSSTMEFRAGLIYLDRLKTKLLPAGGVVWMPGGPNGDIRWDFLFPNPKFSQRLTYFGTWDLWWYIAGEYGMGSWAFQSTTLFGGATAGQADINDLRLIAGLEWTTVSGIKGFVEAGWVFNREFYTGGTNIDLKDTLMLRGGVTF